MKILPDTDPRHKTYMGLQKDCFGFYAYNAAKSMDELTNELIQEGFTHLENFLGHIQIRGDNIGFVIRQEGAKRMSTDKVR